MLEVNGRRGIEVFQSMGVFALKKWNSVDEAREFLLRGLRIHHYNRNLIAQLFETELVAGLVRQKYCKGKNCAHVLN